MKAIDRSEVTYITEGVTEGVTKRDYTMRTSVKKSHINYYRTLDIITDIYIYNVYILIYALSVGVLNLTTIRFVGGGGTHNFIIKYWYCFIHGI